MRRRDRAENGSPVPFTGEPLTNEVPITVGAELDLMALGTRALRGRARRVMGGLASTRRNPGALLGIALLGLVIFLAVVGPRITGYSPTAQELQNSLHSPNWHHLLGTDQLGRDIAARIVAGARISLEVAVLVLGIASVVGGTLGLLAGYYGGVIDAVIMRTADLFFAFPQFLLAMAIVAALGQSLNHAILSVAFAYWPRYARLMRAGILSAKTTVYVRAAQAVGCTNRRIMVRHLVPNCISPLLIQATMDAGIAILTTAALSFVGLGAVPPTPEWGAMVTEGRGFITTAWWIPFFPGLMISIAVAGFMFLGDGLRDSFDPRVRNRIGF
jgi:peptide/nickel transport system permease protein